MIIKARATQKGRETPNMVGASVASRGSHGNETASMEDPFIEKSHHPVNDNDKLTASPFKLGGLSG